MATCHDRVRWQTATMQPSRMSESADQNTSFSISMILPCGGGDHRCSNGILKVRSCLRARGIAFSTGLSLLAPRPPTFRLRTSLSETKCIALHLTIIHQGICTPEANKPALIHHSSGTRHTRPPAVCRVRRFIPPSPETLARYISRRHQTHNRCQPTRKYLRK